MSFVYGSVIPNTTYAYFPLNNFQNVDMPFSERSICLSKAMFLLLSYVVMQLIFENTK